MWFWRAKGIASPTDAKRRRVVGCLSLVPSMHPSMSWQNPSKSASLRRLMLSSAARLFQAMTGSASSSPRSRSESPGS